MTFSCPSFLAAAMRPFMPPKAAAEVAVPASTAAALVLAVAEPLLLAAAAELLEELEELAQPAARRMEPTAAAVATIALDARKVKPSPAAPRVWGELGILARQVVILANQLERKVSQTIDGSRPSYRDLRSFSDCPKIWEWSGDEDHFDGDAEVLGDAHPRVRVRDPSHDVEHFYPERTRGSVLWGRLSPGCGHRHGGGPPRPAGRVGAAGVLPLPAVSGGRSARLVCGRSARR